MRPVDDWAFSEMIANARPEDRREFESVRGLPLDTELRYTIDSSEQCRAFVHGGQVVAIFGCQRFNDQIGIPWLISTTAITQCKRAFLQQCLAEVGMMRKCHAALINYTDARYPLALRWMRWMGFEQQDAVPYGANGELFHPFTMRGDLWAQQQD